MKSIENLEMERGSTEQTKEAQKKKRNPCNAYERKKISKLNGKNTWFLHIVVKRNDLPLSVVIGFMLISMARRQASYEHTENPSILANIR